MFVISIAAAIVIGYILGGKIKNLENINLRAIYLVFIAFALEFSIVICIRNGILKIGTVTYILDVIIYSLITIFVILNKNNIFIDIMGIGFLFNAISIFVNGGAMPVSQEAIKIVGFSTDISSEGLYTVVDYSTRLWFLCDIIPIRFISKFIISIGDIFAATGLILLVITGMKKS